MHWAGTDDALGSGWVAAGFAAGRRTLCVAGVALGDMDCHFAWQAWHLMHWICHFAWQAWHLMHWAGTDDALGCGWSPHTLRGMRGTW